MPREEMRTRQRPPGATSLFGASAQLSHSAFSLSRLFFECFFILVSVVFVLGVHGYCVLSLLAGELPRRAARNLCNTNGVGV